MNIQDAQTCGFFTLFANGKFIGKVKNTWVNEGLTYLIGALDSGRFTQETNMYLALHSGATAPVVGWTASSYPTVAAENQDTDIGYTGNRPLWTPDAAANNIIDSANTPSRFPLVSTSGTVTFTGLALLSRDLRGGTQGKLISAANFTTPLTFPDGTNFDVGWGGSLAAA